MQLIEATFSMPFAFCLCTLQPMIELSRTWYLHARLRTKVAAHKPEAGGGL